MPKKTPIVTQLLMESSDPNISVVTLLRKAKIIATKLNLSDVLGWINYELNGYDNCKGKDLPEYRQGRGEPKGFDLNSGWLPIIFNDVNQRKSFSSIYLAYIWDAVGPLEDLMNESKNDSKNNSTFVRCYPPKTRQILMDAFECADAHLEIPKAFVHRILSAFRNSILEWCLKLEESGITGESLMLPEVSEGEEGSMTQNIYAQNIGHIGNTYDKSKVINTQTAFAQYKSESTTNLIEEIEKTIDLLPVDRKELVRYHVQEIKTEIEKPDTQQNRSKIVGAVHSIKSICEGVAGNVVAQGIISLINNL